MKKIAVLALFVVFGATASAADKDIVATAVDAKDFPTLVAALKEAGLVETLQGKGPFTVFAPSEEAFKKIPKDKLDAVMKDKELLKKILLVHVVAGSVMAEDAMKLDGKDVKTVGGSSFKLVANAKEGVSLGGAKVTKADIKCGNGVIHVIDTVLMPN